MISSRVIDRVKNNIGIVRGIKDVLFDIRNFKTKFYSLDSVKKFNLRRLRNFILSHLARGFGIVVKNIRPRTLFIETVKGCNFKCIMCKGGTFEKEYMSFDRFKRIVDMFPDSFILYPYSDRGEPFLNREIYKMLNYASSKNFYIIVSSNFSVIDAERVLGTGVDEIVASIDSVNPDRFGKIRENGNFNIVARNLRKLIELKRKRGYKKPIVPLRMVVMKENLDEVEDVINFGIKEGIERFYVDTVYVAEWYVPDFANSNSSELTREDIKKLKTSLQKYKNEGIKIKFTSYCSFESGDHFSGYCDFAFSSLSIDIYGNAFPCCFLFVKPESTFGNIFEDFEKVMMNRYKFLKNFRKKVPDACKGCPIYYRP